MSAAHKSTMEVSMMMGESTRVPVKLHILALALSAWTMAVSCVVIGVLDTLLFLSLASDLSKPNSRPFPSPVRVPRLLLQLRLRPTRRHSTRDFVELSLWSLWCQIRLSEIARDAPL